MFHENAFYCVEANAKEEIIAEIGKKMTQVGLIDEGVVASVLDREKISATDIGHMVAIPHSPINGIHKSVIGVAVLDKPILWDKYEVQVVFMICFNLAERKNLQIFKYMYNLIEDADLVKSIIKCKSFQSFMRIIQDGI
nr:PTS sugar transporter subunit IIA [Anaerosolibacter carboniphilus]